MSWVSWRISAAVEVGVFDAQQKAPPVCRAKEPVVERGARISYVKKPVGEGAKRTRAVFVRHEPESKFDLMEAAGVRQLFSAKELKLAGFYWK